MKKLYFIFIVLFIICTPIFADYNNRRSAGISYSGGIYPTGYINGVNIDINPFTVPLHLSFTANYLDSFSIQTNVSWRFFNQPLLGSISWYFGSGLGSEFFFDIEKYDIYTFAQAGLQVFPLDQIELFLEIKPDIGISFSQNPIIFRGGVSFLIGSRFWFN